MFRINIALPLAFKLHFILFFPDPYAWVGGNRARDRLIFSSLTSFQ